MEQMDYSELDQKLLQVRIDNPTIYGLSLSANRLGRPGDNWARVRGPMEECMMNGGFTPTNFPLLYGYLTGRRVRVPGNHYILRCPDNPRERDQDLLLADGKRHLSFVAIQNDDAKLVLNSVKILEVNECMVDFVFDTRIRCEDELDDEFSSFVFWQGVKVVPSSAFDKLLLVLLKFWDKLKYRRSEGGLVAYKEITSWDDCIEMVGHHAEKECEGGLVKGFLYLSEFLMDWRHQQSLKSLQRLSNTPYVMANTGTSLLSRNLGSFNLVSLQEEIRRTEIFLKGLKSVEDIMQNFINRLEKRNPNGVDLRVGLGNWRPVLGLITVVKVSQDAASYVDDRRPYIATVARLVMDGVLNPVDLPAI